MSGRELEVGTNEVLLLKRHLGEASPVDHELDRFKRTINFINFAQTKGYQLDRRASSISCLVLHDTQGDKLIVGRSSHGYWRYQSVRERADAGSIIDFLQKRTPKSLKAIRSELRQWTHTARDVTNIDSTEAFPITEEQTAIALAIARAYEPPSHPYLESRGLTRETLSDPRFRGSWKQEDGALQNVLLPHHDFDGLCGFAWANSLCSGFSKGGSEGLWQSHCMTADTKLVITESPIDAFSYHQLQQDAHTRYIALTGHLNATQPRLISMAMAFMQGQAAVIVAATSSRQTGHVLADSIHSMATDYGFGYQRHLPPGGNGWSQYLQRLCRKSSTRLRVGH